SRRGYVSTPEGSRRGLDRTSLPSTPPPADRSKPAGVWRRRELKIRACPQAWWILVAALAVPACRESSGPQPDPSGTPVTSGPSEWPMYGHDPSRTSHNPAETALSVAAVPRLAARWQAFVDIGPLPPSCTPAV